MHLPHLKQAFNLESISLPEAPKNPLQSKLTFKAKPVEEKKPAPSNMNTTGISIMNGNYLNISKR